MLLRYPERSPRRERARWLEFALQAAADHRAGDGQGASRTPPSTVTTGWSRSTRSAASRRASAPRSRSSTRYYAERRAAAWPCSLNATATHDTKRSEDVRARIARSRRCREEWRAHVVALGPAHRGPRDARSTGEPAPDRNDEYLLYQTLVGAFAGGRARHAQGWRRVRAAHRGLHGEGGARGQDAHQLDQSGRSATRARCAAFVEAAPRARRRSWHSCSAVPSRGGWRGSGALTSLSHDALKLPRARRARRLPGLTSCGTSRWSIPTTAGRWTSSCGAGCSTTCAARR